MTLHYPTTLPAIGSRLLGALLLTFALACGDDDSGDADDAMQDGSTGTMDTPCERGCEATLRADCTMGPSSRAECETDCEAQRSGACGIEYRELMDCGEGEDVTCSQQGFPAVEACEAEQTAFVECLNN